MKEGPRICVTHFRKSNFKNKIKRLQIPKKLLNETFYVHKKILHIRNCRNKFIKDLIPEKRKENM